MSIDVKLRAGTPDDDNRDYVPESILGSDIVVNENGNNSQPIPENLKEVTGVLADGLTDTWYEYVPASYDASKPVPLVVSNHGGLMTGWAQCVYTSWTYVADRDGFIVVFPTANKNRFWSVEGTAAPGKTIMVDGRPVPAAPKGKDDNHDLKFIKALIEETCQKYNIDKSRIYMQGMSMGNMMTTNFAKYYGYMLAGIAGAGGPGRYEVIFDENGNVKNEGGPVPVWQTRPENNGFGMRSYEVDSGVNDFNRYYWMKVNEVDPVPEISIIGEDNFAFFKGKKADQVFLDVKNRDHGQTLDEAYLYWDYFFSGLRRAEDGSIVNGESRIPRKGDAYAAAFVLDMDMLWWKNKVCKLSQPVIRWQKLKYHGLNGGQKVRGKFTMVPLSFLAEMAGADYKPSEDTLTCVVTLPDGRDLQFARGSIGCMIDDTMRQMYCEALYRNGELLVSVEWFAKYLLNLTVSECNGVIYVTDHAAELSYFCAKLIRQTLEGVTIPEDMTVYKNYGWDDYE